MRLGPNSQKLTTAEQMRDFFQQSNKIYFDEAPCKDFDPSREIDNQVLAEFKIAAHLSINTPDNQIFNNLYLLTGDNRFKNGAVLFFGKQPESYFEKATVRCVVFKGLDKRYIIDDKFFGGSLFFQYQKALQWLNGKLDVRYDIEGQGSGPRKEIWEIPEIVFKEAIINSLSHRDYYDKGATTTIELFDDRVEISNPGGLMSAISRSEFGKRSHSRNPLIFGFFARINLVEQIGSGVNRMNNLIKEAGLPQPVFHTEGMFSVSFRRPAKASEKTSEKTVEETSEKTVKGIVEGAVEETSEKTVEETSEKTSEKIIKLIKNNPEITIDELADHLGRSIRAVEMQLQKLKEQKKIERIGPEKGGYWQLTTNRNS